MEMLGERHLKRRLIATTLLGSLLLAGWARAGETPLYQPHPDWVIPAQLPSPAALAAGGSATVIVDRQQRISNGSLWSYADTAQRISSAEQLNQLANLTLPWLPDKGDLIIHELAIIRDGQTIDQLAGGRTFTVIRREQALERRELTGILTATMAVEGLRVGDVLRVRASTTSKDNALNGHVQGVMPVLTAPVSIGQGKLRTLWDNDSDLKWKIGLSSVTATPVRGPQFTELNIPLPAPRQADVPADAPGRFKPLPILEVSTFADWGDVSRTMHPLFATEGLIKPGSPIIAEIEAIKRSERTPLGRAQKALRLVQDQIRYLAVSMDGGNYVPQTPEQTWAMRYGDCKAKTLLLLAMLREMGIEAEAILAHTEAGDVVVNRLPAAAAFNHILVRAVIDGESLWLDGTGIGSRIEDIRDTPPFGHVLPLRHEGAELIRIEPRQTGRPSFDLTMRMDESSSVDLPAVFDLSLVLRGAAGVQLNLVRNQLDSQKQQEVMGQFLSRIIGDSYFGDITLAPNDQAGVMTIKARGVTASAWRWDDKMLQRPMERSLGTITFEPDRARAAWSSIPVATPPPDARRFRTEIRLPQGGQGFRIEGSPMMAAQVAGFSVNRSASIAKGVLTVEERVDSTGSEIVASNVGAEKDKLATARAQAPKLVAPSNVLRQWDVSSKDPAGGTQIAAAEAVYANVIANAPDKAAPYRARAALRRAINNSSGALADISRAIELEPDAGMYLMRAQLHEETGDLQAALADADSARSLDPSSVPATFKVANLLAETGDLNGAVSLLDQRISLGGEARRSFQEGKADLIGRFGDPSEALALVDSLMADRPGAPTLLNMSCWIKGTRDVSVDTAVKDCTAALEGSNSPYAILDSRAMIYYRQGRYEDAIRDLTAVLGAIPGMAESRYLRGVIYARLDRTPESKADLAIARRIKPRIDQEYARFGIQP
jgi:tetratricopeptide (TPR) repeat protein